MPLLLFEIAGENIVFSYSIWFFIANSIYFNLCSLLCLYNLSKISVLTYPYLDDPAEVVFSLLLVLTFFSNSPLLYGYKSLIIYYKLLFYLLLDETNVGTNEYYFI
jgi:hypothetical protein